MNIDKLKAGPELDALVVVKVMGCQVTSVEFEGRLWYRCGCAGAPHGKIDHTQDRSGGWERGVALQEYSTDIAAAWQVVEKLDLFRDNVLLGANKNYDRGWQIVEDGQELGDTIAEAETAPLVICLAGIAIAEAMKKPRPVADNMVHLPCGKKPDRCAWCMEYVCPACYPDHDKTCAYSCPTCHQKACGHSNEPKL